MNVADAIGQILKAEGVEYLFAYPVNPIIEGAAKVGIRPIIVRQERIGLHMADAVSSDDFRRTNRGILHAKWPGFRKRLRRRGPGIWGLGANRGAADGLFAQPDQHAP